MVGPASVRWTSWSVGQAPSASPLPDRELRRPSIICLPSTFAKIHFYHRRSQRPHPFFSPSDCLPSRSFAPARRPSRPSFHDFMTAAPPRILPRSLATHEISSSVPSHPPSATPSEGYLCQLPALTATAASLFVAGLRARASRSLAPLSATESRESQPSAPTRTTAHPSLDP